MEGTDIYCVPDYDHFKKEGFDVCLINEAHAKNVPGRKTDILDSEWHYSTMFYPLFVIILRSGTLHFKYCLVNFNKQEDKTLLRYR